MILFSQVEKEKCNDEAHHLGWMLNWSFASSQYTHLIKELWRCFPLKVMIRIQHKERKGQQQLARKGLLCKWIRVGGCTVNTINIRSELYSRTSHVEDLTLKTVHTDWLLCEQKGGLAAFNGKGKKFRGHLNLSLKLSGSKTFTSSLISSATSVAKQRWPFLSLIQINQSASSGQVF